MTRNTGALLALLALLAPAISSCNSIYGHGTLWGVFPGVRLHAKDVSRGSAETVDGALLVLIDGAASLALDVAMLPYDLVREVEYRSLLRRIASEQSDAAGSADQ